MQNNGFRSFDVFSVDFQDFDFIVVRNRKGRGVDVLKAGRSGGRFHFVDIRKYGLPFFL